MGDISSGQYVLGITSKSGEILLYLRIIIRTIIIIMIIRTSSSSVKAVC